MMTALRTPNQHASSRSRLDCLSTELVFAIADRCDDSAAATALCRARWGDKALDEPEVRASLKRAKLWQHGVVRARQGLPRPEPVAVAASGRATQVDCTFFGGEVGRVLAALVCACTVSSLLISASVSNAPMEVRTMPRANHNFASMQAFYREHGAQQLWQVAMLFGWVPAGYVLGRFALAPGFLQGCKAWGQAAAARRLLGESQATLSVHDRRALYRLLRNNLAISASGAVVCGAVLAAAAFVAGVQLRNAAAAMASHGLSEHAALGIACVLGALLVTGCGRSDLWMFERHLPQRRSPVQYDQWLFWMALVDTPNWDRRWMQRGDVFFADGYHQYIDALEEKLSTDE